VDYQRLVTTAPLIVDTRNAIKPQHSRLPARLATVVRPFRRANTLSPTAAAVMSYSAT
jgi:hypothetical protein